MTMSVVWFAFAGLLLTAAISDLKSYRIPNWVCVAIAATFAIAAPLGMPFDQIWPHIAVGASVFGVGYLLYAVTGMGAGDAKLGAAIGLWIGPAGLLTWLTHFALGMLALAIVLIGLRRAVALVGGPEPSFRLLQRGAPVPLGVALSFSALLASPGFVSGLWAF